MDARPFLRTTTFLYGVTNPIGPGVLLALVVVSQQQGLSPMIIGGLLATFSGCLLIGALLSGLTDSVVVAYRLAVTPDRLVGRVESVRSTIALALAPFGSLVAGLLLSAMPARLAVPILVVPSVPIAIWGLLSHALWNPPSPQEGDIVPE